MALERFFEDLSNGHEFFIDQAFWLAGISKTGCPVFFFATVMSNYLTVKSGIIDIDLTAT